METKGHGRVRVASRVLNLGNRCRWVVGLPVLWLRFWEKNSRNPMERKLGRSHKLCWRCRERKNLLSGIESRFLGQFNRSLMLTPTELSLFHIILVNQTIASFVISHCTKVAFQCIIHQLLQSMSVASCFLFPLLSKNFPQQKLRRFQICVIILITKSYI